MVILSAYGMPKKIVDAINILHKNTVAQVITPDGETDLFEVTAGVLQGDSLAPFLFIIAVDYALRQATRDTSIGFMLEKRQDSRKPAIFTTDADFAGDLALLSNYMEQAQLLLQRSEIASETIGLHINCKKTEHMMFNQTDTELKSLGGQLLKQVEAFKYIGSWIADSKREMEVRVGLAWTRFGNRN